MPGPAARYRPRFAPEALRRCQEILRQHNAPFAHVQRARLALLLAERPDLSTAELSRRLNMGTSFVWVWRKRWALGPFTLEDRPRSGRPSSKNAGDGAGTPPEEDPARIPDPRSESRGS